MGGNLSIESLQDTSSQVSKQNSSVNLTADNAIHAAPAFAPHIKGVMMKKKILAALLPCCLLTACYTPYIAPPYKLAQGAKTATILIPAPFAPGQYDYSSVSRRELKCDANNAVVNPAPYSGELARFSKKENSAAELSVGAGYAQYDFAIRVRDRSCGFPFWAKLEAGHSYEMVLKYVYEGNWPLTKQSCTATVKDRQSGETILLSKFDDPPEENDPRCTSPAGPAQGTPTLSRGAGMM
ncbi:hypothetical protein N8A90_19150 [Variovorax sp. N23]|nr:hypothetical protein [Variovorax sp. N23]MCU4121200.1 hypothetical protein [Variovorax sp. N23]